MNHNNRPTSNKEPSLSQLLLNGLQQMSPRRTTSTPTSPLVSPRTSPGSSPREKKIEPCLNECIQQWKEEANQFDGLDLEDLEAVSIHIKINKKPSPHYQTALEEFQNQLQGYINEHKTNKSNIQNTDEPKEVFFCISMAHT